VLSEVVECVVGVGWSVERILGVGVVKSVALVA
jgi:hypothetical protein